MDGHECPDDHPHSTHCYNVHGCRCERCQRVKYKANSKTLFKRKIRERNAGLRIDAAPAMRKLQALAYMGWDAQSLARMGVAHRETLTNIRNGNSKRIEIRTYLKVSKAYSKLCMKVNENDYQGRARGFAIRSGYRSPLEWKDVEKGILDDPHS